MARISRRSALILGLIAALLVPSQVLAVGGILPGQAGLGDLDRRTDQVTPNASQRQTVQQLGAHVTWNAYGTPHSLIRYGGYLATGLQGATAADAARAWLTTNKGLFRLTSAAPNALELVNDSQLVDSKGHVVLFRQLFGSLPAVQDGMITLGLVGTTSSGWKLAYVSSTAAGTQAAPSAASITGVEAWLAAAEDAGVPSTASKIAKVHTEDGWRVFTVAGFGQLQRARLRALPIAGQGVRAVWEVNVLDVQGGDALAYTSLVDGINKKIWFRQNKVEQVASEPESFGTAQTSDAATSTSFGGTTGPGGTCGPTHPIDTPAGTLSIDVVATATVPADDIVLKLLQGATTIATSDQATSPEAIHYAPAGGVNTTFTYSAQVCPFDAGAAPFTYSGFAIAQDSASAESGYPPEWAYFPVSPKLNYGNQDIRIEGCWEKTAAVPGCDLVLKNLASRAPWDFDVRTNTPTFTSIGNNAKTAEAWISPLTPGENYSPPKSDRKYLFPWSNQWYTSKCDLTNFVSPARNDIDASIINLFAGHNRFHDFSYFLGFTEQNYNMQDDNFGNTAPGPFPGRENDPEIGNVQAGAVTGGAPSYQGRDNANQITLQDGIPGITNQYLFQPIAAAFYSPCVDGDFDTTVFGHEYTHAISNRMVGGPDSGLTGDQSGAMGESWSDLDALEYLHEFGYVPLGGENPWALGAYATGNKQVGIRNYALDANPLNYGDIGYDSACGAPLVGPPVEPACAVRSEVHSDGEIWNAVNYDIRQALVSKYNGAYPATNATLQRECANGERAAKLCPGNRRWIQIVYDAFLLMPPDVSMLDARDAYLAADVMRFGGANQQALWHAFARRGMGDNASTADADDADPTPGFRSPLETSHDLRFSAVDANGDPISATIFVGKFEAAVSPIADTDVGTPLTNRPPMVAGKYDFVATAPGYGHLRFSWTMPDAKSHVTLHFQTNWASGTNGAVASGDGGNFGDLIDDTEATDWARIAAPVTVNGTQVTVDLGGSTHVVDRVQVSAMLHPRDDADDYDNIGQSRFSTLRSFDIQTCTAAPANSNCGLPAVGWTTVGHFVNAFGATIPRPLMPNMLIRSFDVTNTVASHVRLIVLDNQCTGNPAYAGEQDNDPTNNTDCTTASAQDTNVRVAELQVFSANGVAGATQDPVVALTATAPATAAAGSTMAYVVTYTNLGPNTASHPTLTLTLPLGLAFQSASNHGSWASAGRVVTWSLADLAVGASGSRTVSVRIDSGVETGTALLAQALFSAPNTFANPAWATTVVQ